eukprot:CFRG3448T1
MWSRLAKTRRFYSLNDLMMKKSFWKTDRRDWARLLSHANDTTYVKYLGTTMAPTLDDSEQLLEIRNRTSLSSLHKGDVVALKMPDDDSRLLVRRITAEPGEELVSDEGEEPFHLKENEFWVSNDVDTVTEESRAFGPITGDSIVGRVMSVVDNNYKRRGYLVNSPDAALEDHSANLVNINEMKSFVAFYMKYKDYFQDMYVAPDENTKGKEEEKKDKGKK